jgi:hypothetical protein
MSGGKEQRSKPLGLDFKKPKGRKNSLKPSTFMIFVIVGLTLLVFILNLLSSYIPV